MAGVPKAPALELFTPAYSYQTPVMKNEEGAGGHKDLPKKKTKERVYNRDENDPFLCDFETKREKKKLD